MSQAESLDVAKTHHRRGELDQAEAIYRSILNENSTDPDALHLLGVLAHQKGQNEEAIELILQALQHRAPFPSARNNLASVFNAQGDFAAALSQLELVLSVQPEFADALYNKGVALQGQGNLSTALAAYDESLRYDSSLVAAYVNKAIILQRQERGAEAQDCLRKAIELDPKSSEARFNLGSLLMASGDYSTAAAEFRETVKILPRLPQAHANLGHALRRIGRYEEAIDAFETALTLAPDNAVVAYELTKLLFDINDARAPDARLNLGVALLRSGDAEAALDAFEANIALIDTPVREMALKSIALRELGRHSELTAHIALETAVIRGDLLLNDAVGAYQSSMPCGEAEPIDTLANAHALTDRISSAVELFRSNIDTSRTLHATTQRAQPSAWYKRNIEEFNELSSAYHPEAIFVALCVLSTDGDCALEIGCPDPSRRIWDNLKSFELRKDSVYVLPAYWHYKLTGDACSSVVLEFCDPGPGG